MFDCFGQSTEPQLDLCRNCANERGGGYVSFDPNLREEVWSEPQELQATVMRAVGLADVVKFSEEELQFLTGTQSIEEGLQAIADFQILLLS